MSYGAWRVVGTGEVALGRSHRALPAVSYETRIWPPYTSRKVTAATIWSLLCRCLPPMRTHLLDDRRPRSDDLFQVTRSDPHRGDEPDVGQLAALAEPIDGRVRHAEVLRHLGYLQQPIAPAPEDLQVGRRGGQAGPLSRLRRRRGACPPGAACAPPCAIVASELGRKRVDKSLGNPAKILRPAGLDPTLGL